MEESIFVNTNVKFKMCVYVCMLLVNINENWHLH
jgi:hypothetical protein